MTNKIWIKSGIALALALLVTVFVFIFTELSLAHLFNNFEAKMMDWRYRSRINKLTELRKGAPIEDILIIDIDDRSLEKLGRFSQWPRNYHTQLIDYLSQCGAAAIGFDILFLEPDQLPDHDQDLIRATRQSGKLYLALSFSNADSSLFLYAMAQAPPEFNAERFSTLMPEILAQRIPKFDRLDGELYELYNAATGTGFVNFTPIDDSVIRSFPILLNFAGRQYPTLGLAMALGLLGLTPANLQIEPGTAIKIKSQNENLADFAIPIDKSCQMLINFQGDFRSFRYISYYDVLEKRLPDEYFKGKIILVGTSAAGLADIKPVPFLKTFPGVEIHANVLYNILTQDFLHSYSQRTVYLFVFILAAAMSMVAMFFRPWQIILILLVLGATFLFTTSKIFIQSGTWMQQVRPMMGLLLSFMTIILYRYVDEERNRRMIKRMFQNYLSAAVVNELLKKPEMLKLGGERREATAFFSDIKSFTTFSENQKPEELVTHLNEYLSAMTDIVLRYNGYLDKYEGDAIMAIFGVPVSQEDHADRACLAALDMQAKMVELRKKWRTEGKPEFYIRIGINSGPMIAGNIGGLQRMDYTVIGDAVNLASRLEGANKQYGTDIMISEFTRQRFQRNLVVRELDLIRVKGKTQPVRVFELISPRPELLTEEKKRLLMEFERGLVLYRHRDWDQAIKAFRAAQSIHPDSPSATYIERCELFKGIPVPKGWDGVFELESK